MKKDLTAKIFGRWTVISQAGVSRHQCATWNCRCICGKDKIVEGRALRIGKSKSCGCLKTEVSAEGCRKRATHGMANSYQHRLWWGILARCRNPKSKSFKYYGAKGRMVCEFIAAHPGNIEKVMGVRPTMIKPREFSIDRKNNDGHYSCGVCPECVKNGWPMNLRWATYEEQRLNFGTNTSHARI